MVDEGWLFGERDHVRVGDVTLVRGEPSTTRREKLARVILDELFEFVGLLDADGNTIEINRAALDGAGISLAQIARQPFWEARWWAISRESSDESRAMVERARAGEFVRCDVEVYGRSAGDETIVVDYSLTPIRDDDDRIVFLLPEGRNITDKKRAELELARTTRESQQLLERVRELDNAKSAFFANVSHELRTPLTLILGPLDVLAERATELSPDDRHHIEVIRRNALTLLKQVNTLLDLAKSDAGEMELNYAQVDLAEWVPQVAAHFEGVAAQRDITFVVNRPTTLTAEVDADKYERVLLNLLSNAFKFTPDGGRVLCRIERSASKRALLTVQDSGPGIPESERVAIFERYRQASHGGDRSGTGLGLAIAKEFVELHHGTITVVPTTQGGSVFQVEIPIKAPTSAYVRPAQDRVTGHGQPQRDHALGPDASTAPISGTLTTGEPLATRPEVANAAHVLVVEDNPDMLRFITETLGHDLRVSTATGGRDALASARHEPPDLIVTDLMMPDGSGDDLVTALRAEASTRNIPVLVLSARSDDQLRHRLLDNAVQDYLVKPFSAHELRARVRNLVTTKRTRDALQRELESHNDDIAELTDELIRARRDLQVSHDRQRAAEDRWRVSQTELARVSRATSLGELAASIAHEINQPLAAVVANGQACLRWLAAEPRNDEEAVAAVERIVRDATRAGEIIGGVRSFLRRGPTSFGAVDLTAIVTEVVSIVASYAAAKDVALTTTTHHHQPSVEIAADGVQLTQVVLNLVMNAVEAAGTADQPRLVTIELDASDERRTATVRVSDTGDGVGADDRQRIFEPFFTTKPEGVGMGLAISRSIVETHRGVLRLDARRPTTFVVELPIDPETA